MSPELTALHLLQKQHLLRCEYDNGRIVDLSCEYLRVYSPSAEVRGHGQALPKLLSGKAQVNIVGIEPIGAYGVKLIFDDGHDSGIYTFDYLYDLGLNQTQYWQTYLERLTSAGETRDA